jgi:hypothetical protein
LEFGTRFARATSELDGASGAQTDDAVYAAAGRETAAGSLKAIVAWDRGGNAGIPGAAASAGLVGSLSGDRQLGARWTAHAGTVSNLRIPTFAQVNGAAPLTLAGDRSLLFEQSLEYTDLRRLRVKLIAYTQRSTGSATGHVNGIGIDAAWQIAPLLAARAWLLRANQSTVPAAYANQTTPAQAYDTSAYAAPAVTAAAAAPLTRSLLWLSYGSGLRLDALVRGGPLEGDVRVPCGGAYAFTLGTAVYAGRRVTTFGVTRR